MGTEPMFAYVMPPSGGTHGLRRRRLADTWALVGEWFAAWTDCVGAHAIDGLPPGRAASLVVPRRDAEAWDAPRPRSMLDAVTAQLDELVREDLPRSLTLAFEFLLRDPSEGSLLPYADGHFPGGYSEVLLFLRDGTPSSAYLTLRWPYPGPNEVVVATCDGVREHLRIELSESKFMHGERTRQGTIRYRRHRFGAGTRATVAPRVDRVATDVEQRLLEAIRDAPDDDGPRLAYADALTQRGDPRGELIVVQCQLAALPTADDPRRPALARREHALLRKHGRGWLRVPYVDAPVMRRGFVEEVRVRTAADFIANADAIFAAAPLVRDVHVIGRRADVEAEVLRASPLAARLRSVRVG